MAKLGGQKASVLRLKLMKLLDYAPHAHLAICITL
jgi:hypothetical protein